MYTVILRRTHETTVAMESKKYYMFLCVYVRARTPALVRACVSVRACVRASKCACVYAWVDVDAQA